MLPLRCSDAFWYILGGGLQAIEEEGLLSSFWRCKVVRHRLRGAWSRYVLVDKNGQPSEQVHSEEVSTYRRAWTDYNSGCQMPRSPRCPWAIDARLLKSIGRLRHETMSSRGGIWKSLRSMIRLETSCFCRGGPASYIADVCGR